MSLNDALGLSLSSATPESVDAYETSLGLLQCYRGDPLAEAENAIARAPGMVMAHVLKGWLNLLGTEPSGVAAARAALQAARDLPATARERGHLKAVGLLVERRWHEAGRVLEDVAIEHPRDILALQVGHQIDFFTGASRMLRDRIARALPEWSADMPGYHALLGMHAFGLEETGDYAAAERQGRRGVELEKRDAWSQHAVAHVMEMQGRQREGIAWMRQDSDAWSSSNFMAVHNWWHLAMFHLDLGEIDQVLALYDGPIYGPGSALAMDMVDASAMLWRLQLRGVDVGERWQKLADNWAPLAGSGHYAFNDVHAAMAFVGAGRRDRLSEILEAQRVAMGRTDDNAMFTREVGHPVTLALKAFGERDDAEVLRRLRPVRGVAHRLGGSHAQRDIIDLTIIAAALRAGETALARALAAERLAVKPTSPFNRTLASRAGEHRMAA